MCESLAREAPCAISMHTYFCMLDFSNIQIMYGMSGKSKLTIQAGPDYGQEIKINTSIDFYINMAESIYVLPW